MTAPNQLSDVIMRAARASQPTPTTGTLIGALYYVTDENVTERWSGSAWEDVSDAGSGGYADILDIPTAETDDTLVLAPDGAGGVEFRAEAGGSADPYAWTSLTGWTAFGSPDTANVDSTVPNRLYLKEAANASVHVVGEYLAVPSYPFTIDLFVEDATPLETNYQRLSGLGIAEASLTGKVHAIHADHDSSKNGRAEMSLVYYNSITSFNSILASKSDMGMFRAPIYYRMVAASATDISWYWSDGGKVWRALDLNRNPGFTPGAICVLIDPEQADHAVEAALGIYIH